MDEAVLEIDTINNMVVIDGESYPPTKNNLTVWRKYQETKDKQDLKLLSTVSLDI